MIFIIVETSVTIADEPMTLKEEFAAINDNYAEKIKWFSVRRIVLTVIFAPIGWAFVGLMIGFLIWLYTDNEWVIPLLTFSGAIWGGLTGWYMIKQKAKAEAKKEDYEHCDSGSNRYTVKIYSDDGPVVIKQLKVSTPTIVFGAISFIFLCALGIVTMRMGMELDGMSEHTEDIYWLVIGAIALLGVQPSALIALLLHFQRHTRNAINPKVAKRVQAVVSKIKSTSLITIGERRISEVFEIFFTSQEVSKDFVIHNTIRYTGGKAVGKEYKPGEPVLIEYNVKKPRDFIVTRSKHP